MRRIDHNSHSDYYGHIMATWGVAEAKAKFSEMLEAARADGIQEVTRNGRTVGYFLSPERYRTLTEPARSSSSCTTAEFFRNSPLRGLKLDLKRNLSKARKVDL